MEERQYDVIVWGATGFTGKLIVEYLYETYGLDGDVGWAIAGRSAEKLEQIKKDVAGENADKIPHVVANSHDEESLRAMVSDTRAVCSTVGPYALYGTELVQLCAELGTHYCDLTGEIPWMRKMIDQYFTVAESSGARIVHSCGFDSIPSDLGTFYVQQMMQEKHGVYAPRVKCRVIAFEGGMSGGTFASGMSMMEELKNDPSLIELTEDPYALNPSNMPRGDDGPDQTTAEYDQDFHQWTAPFIMAPLNSRVVRRSHALMDYPWGKHFRYDEAVLSGDGPGGLAKATLTSGAMGLMQGMMRLEPARSLAARVAPAPGEGPSEETIRNGFFEIELFAAHPEDPEKNLTAVVTGDRDPGYGATSKMIAESAVCLAKDNLDTPTGILTPAVAMGMSLVNRLKDKGGMTFDIK